MKLLPPLLLAACLSPAYAQNQAPTDPLASVAWLAGCWSEQGREAGSIEQWTAPAGGLMLGVARTLKGGAVVDYEFMQIRAGADGKLVYIAQPQGRPPTEFKLLRQPAAKAPEAVFENPSHGFPQRVIYRQAAPDRVIARIEGTLNGKELGVDFTLQRMACP
jgi:hypothetical protein